MKNKPTVAIIGGGFCGMMTAVHLMRSQVSLKIIIINEDYPFGKGVAYSAHTEKYLLNVRAINMSAFDEEPQHFLDWLHKQEKYKHIARNILANVYVPRRTYGKYLSCIWKYALENKPGSTELELVHQKATEILQHENSYNILLNNETIIHADIIVLATGNTIPRQLDISNHSFLNSKNYFSNPWSKDCVSAVKDLKNILIVGNGLTMIDTLQGLKENGFNGTSYTISPNGFALLPHKYNLLVYDKIIEELPEEFSLYNIFCRVHKHAKTLTAVGIGSHLVIDALRPYTQQIWQTFTLEEKRKFLKRLSHAWTVLRHRLPLHIYEQVQEMRMNKQLVTFSGRIKDIIENGSNIQVTYLDKKSKTLETIPVDRIINCTGPEPNICRSANELLRNLAAQGMIKPDALQLGIEVDALTGAVININNIKSETMFTLGGNLKGMLWESTAVPDLRIQARRLALHISAVIKEKSKISTFSEQSVQVSDTTKA